MRLTSTVRFHAPAQPPLTEAPDMTPSADDPPQPDDTTAKAEPEAKGRPEQAEVSLSPHPSDDATGRQKPRIVVRGVPARSPSPRTESPATAPPRRKEAPSTRPRSGRVAAPPERRRSGRTRLRVATVLAFLLCAGALVARALLATG